MAWNREQQKSPSKREKTLRGQSRALGPLRADLSAEHLHIQGMSQETKQETWRNTTRNDDENFSNLAEDRRTTLKEYLQEIIQTKKRYTQNTNDKSKWNSKKCSCNTRAKRQHEN